MRAAVWTSRSCGIAVLRNVASWKERIRTRIRSVVMVRKRRQVAGTMRGRAAPPKMANAGIPPETPVPIWREVSKWF